MVSKPRILVTNDDGYASEGIQILADALEGLGEIWVVAPDSEQSAVSHALTLDRPLRIKRLGERRVAVDGTPTDCVAIAISNLMGGQVPDLVVSGINFGFNMGADVHYSGTVSAAFEGVILGAPAMAVSLGVGEGLSFHLAAKFAMRTVGVDPRARPAPRNTAQRQRPGRRAARGSVDPARRAPLHRRRG